MCSGLRGGDDGLTLRSWCMQEPAGQPCFTAALPGVSRRQRRYVGGISPISSKIQVKIIELQDLTQETMYGHILQLHASKTKG